MNMNFELPIQRFYAAAAGGAIIGAVGAGAFGAAYANEVAHQTSTLHIDHNRVALEMVEGGARCSVFGAIALGSMFGAAEAAVEAATRNIHRYRIRKHQQSEIQFFAELIEGREDSVLTPNALAGYSLLFSDQPDQTQESKDN